MALLWAIFLPQSKAVEIIAHRGASLIAPENTLAAINAAIKNKAKFIEIDVQMTKDKQIVVLHDEKINRTTNAKGLVKDKVLAQLKIYDAGSWFSKEFKDEKIPSLDEVLNLVRNTDIQLILEVKNVDNKYPGIESRIVDIVNRSGVPNRIYYKSFSPDVLKKFKRLDTRKLIYVTIGEIPWLNLTIDEGLRFGSVFDIKEFDLLQIHHYFSFEKTLKKARKLNKGIILWDVQNLEAFNKYKSMDIDLIETDRMDFIKILKDTNS